MKVMWWAWGSIALGLYVVSGCAGETEGPSDVADTPHLSDIGAGGLGADVPPSDAAEGTDTAGRTGGGRAPFVYSTSCSLPPAPPSASGLVLVDAFPNLNISYPLLLTHANDGSNRLFVVERFGHIEVFPNDPSVSTSTTFLDLSSVITTESEGGLLGLAFHPDYATNGHFYVNYTVLQGEAMYTRISRFTVSATDPNLADPQSELLLRAIAQPFYNHDGGMIAFGPDGHLYIGMGDGGYAGDPYEHGQDTNTLLGAMLRIDVDHPEDGLNYGIPSDNPFANGGGRREIYAWGLRNPWRFSFDTVTGALWAGDVGQKTWEEITIIGLGENHGWNIMEGHACYPPEVSNCNTEGLVTPVMQYPNAGKGSVTGGYVYRGSRIPSLYGTYIFADYEQYTLYLMPTDEGPPDSPAMDTPDRVAGFGHDAEGEVYVLGLLSGTIYRFDHATPTPTPQVPIPETLGQTGCFTDLTTMTPAPGVIPYD
ncbi:MAG: PQQ-dependent sugar dehydrogenase, partial [Myxococcota bacterium]|nr:PQQ-dependent sugar dehydrogenase [Myxococcota bacterium]